jgi:hypothetical protein
MSTPPIPPGGAPKPTPRPSPIPGSLREDENRLADMANRENGDLNPARESKGLSLETAEKNRGIFSKILGPIARHPQRAAKIAFVVAVITGFAIACIFTGGIAGAFGAGFILGWMITASEAPIAEDQSLIKRTLIKQAYGLRLLYVWLIEEGKKNKAPEPTPPDEVRPATDRA